MPKQNKRRMRRIKNLITVSVLTAIVISVSTFAWFIGMRIVNVSSFDVEIAATESLLLSLDGKKWATTVNISEATLDEVSYPGHTNSWGGKGLLPMSSIGEMDTVASRMKIYEKASLDPTAGGYRLLASRVNNFENGDPEQEGYVVFDLFVRNITGSQYIVDLNPLDEESIYLTTDSEVTVASDGVKNTGIENSVRVAFAQIGRVIGTTTDPDVITGITCAADEETKLPSVQGSVTGICRTAQIWEPNDKYHVSSAINWYNESCKARKPNPAGANLRAEGAYGGACGTVENENSYPTYAVKSPITSADNVDVYDGESYNTYTGTTLLHSYPYFTDTQKMEKGTERPPFMKLAPNSITKIRIYIYIEGQDIDNYDFASIGKRISVKFGFTKERFTDEDVPHTPNPDVDTTRPAITLLGDEVVTIPVGTPYIDAGATATDAEEGDITRKIHVINPVDTSKPGTYYVTYDVNDFALNYADRVIRTVIVE